jgi:hypothetical protein
MRSPDPSHKLQISSIASNSIPQVSQHPPLAAALESNCRVWESKLKRGKLVVGQSSVVLKGTGFNPSVSNAKKIVL